MKSLLSLSLILLSLSLVYSIALPNGQYEGKASVVNFSVNLSVKVTPDSATSLTGKVNITATIFGIQHVCNGEPVKLLADGTTVILVNARKSGYCAHDKLFIQGIDASTIGIKYNPTANSLTVTLSGTSATLTKQDLVKMLGATKLPSGNYAGTVSVIDMIVKVIPDSATSLTGKVDITAIIFGTYIVCTGESAHLLADGTTVILDNAGKSGDCVHDRLGGYGIDASIIGFKYNPTANSFTVTISGTSGTLTKQAKV